MLPPLVATDATDSSTYPMDFVSVHSQGIPHRAVHLEILNREESVFICRREDERLEIPGGHVEWSEAEDRAETYEEAALRECCEELNLPFNWAMSREDCHRRIQGHIHMIGKEINQIPSSQGNNSEWVTVFRLDWQDAWGDPCKFKLSEEGNHEPHWLSIGELKELGLGNPMGINSAVRLMLRRRGILVPLVI
jgi:8-oxo-dGTP pyrophosphatase MutT (NUDIX family)